MRLRLASCLLLGVPLLAMALIVRCPGLYQGIPDALHPDETIVVNRALYFGSGDLDPHFFYYPSFSMYVTSAFVAARAAEWLALRQVHSVEEIKARFANDPVPFYESGRQMALCFGILCILLLGCWGSAFIGSAPAFVAAVLTILLPSLVSQSHYAKPDSLLSFLGLGIFFGACEAHSQRSIRWLYASVGLCGLAFSTKYNAVPFFVAPFLVGVLWLRAGEPFHRRWARHLAGLLSIGTAGIVLGMPYAVLDWKNFWIQISSIKTYTEQGAGAMQDQGFFHNARMIFRTLGEAPGFWILAVPGWLLALISKNFSLRLAAITCLAFLFFVAHQAVSLPRYFDPVLPLLAYAVVGGYLGWENRPAFRIVGGLGVVGLLVLVGRAGHQRVERFRMPVAAQQARRWLLANVPDGSKILTDASGPALPLQRQALSDLLAKAQASHHMKASLFELQLKYYDSSSKHFDVYLSSQAVMTGPPDMIEKSRAVQRLEPLDQGLARILNDHFEYVVVAQNEASLYAPGGPGENNTPYRMFYESLTTSPHSILMFDSNAAPATGAWIRIYRLRS